MTAELAEASGTATMAAQPGSVPADCAIGAPNTATPSLVPSATPNTMPSSVMNALLKRRVPEARCRVASSVIAVVSSRPGMRTMSPANVAYHLRQMSRKFQVKGQAALVAAALVAGVLTSDRWPVLSTTVNCIAALFDGGP